MKKLHIAIVTIAIAVGAAAALYVVMDDGGYPKTASIGIAVATGLMILWVVGYGVGWNKYL